jgi:hypothetical protein
MHIEGTVAAILRRFPVDSGVHKAGASPWLQNPLGLTDID